MTTIIEGSFNMLEIIGIMFLLVIADKCAQREVRKEYGE